MNKKLLLEKIPINNSVYNTIFVTKAAAKAVIKKKKELIEKINYYTVWNNDLKKYQTYKTTMGLIHLVRDYDKGTIIYTFNQKSLSYFGVEIFDKSTNTLYRSHSEAFKYIEIIYSLLAKTKIPEKVLLALVRTLTNNHAKALIIEQGKKDNLSLEDLLNKNVDNYKNFIVAYKNAMYGYDIIFENTYMGISKDDFDLIAGKGSDSLKYTLSLNDTIKTFYNLLKNKRNKTLLKLLSEASAIRHVECR